MIDRVNNSIYALAIFDAINQCNDINLYNGEYGINTSLCLAELDSLSNGLDYMDIMDRFLLILNKQEYCVAEPKISETLKEALINYQAKMEPIHCGIDSFDDQALVRMLPVVFFLRKKYGSSFLKFDLSLEIIDHIAGLTNNRLRSKIACLILVHIVSNLIDYGDELNNILKKTLENFSKLYSNKEMKHFTKMFSFDNFVLSSNVYTDGSAVNTLEAVIYILATTKSLEEALNKGIAMKCNNTSMCLVGGVGGLFYGLDCTFTGYCDSLKGKEKINQILKSYLF